MFYIFDFAFGIQTDVRFRDKIENFFFWERTGTKNDTGDAIGTENEYSVSLREKNISNNLVSLDLSTSYGGL